MKSALVRCRPRANWTASDVALDASKRVSATTEKGGKRTLSLRLSQEWCCDREELSRMARNVGQGSKICAPDLRPKVIDPGIRNYFWLVASRVAQVREISPEESLPCETLASLGTVENGAAEEIDV